MALACVLLSPATTELTFTRAWCEPQASYDLLEHRALPHPRVREGREVGTGEHQGTTGTERIGLNDLFAPSTWLLYGRCP